MEQMNQVRHPQSEKHAVRKPGRTQAQAGQNAGAKQRPRRMARTAPAEHGDAAPQRVKGAQNSRMRPQKGLGSRRRRPMGAKAKQVKIYPLGGLGEVGKNITLYECEGDMLLVDCGLVFPDSEMFGIDLVIPDFTFILQNKDKIKGLLITHGHEDHIGALPYLMREFQVPVYATRLTLGLIKNKLEEHGLASSAKLHEIAPSRRFKLGCFVIEPIHVNHSIPDAVGFAIECRRV